MKITVVEEVRRECCDRERGDFVKIIKSPHENSKFWFCRHCGRHWDEVYTSNPRFPHFSGSPYKPTWRPKPFPWESAADIEDLVPGHADE
jgi:hypothetical protein